MSSEQPILYLPFVDGAIGYDCITCQAGCCRSGRLGVLPSETLYLLGKYPKLATFGELAPSLNNNLITYIKSEPHCWFLQPDHRCEIEVHDGRERKPLICRSHPVYFRSYLSLGCVISHIAPGCVWALEPTDAAVGQLTWSEARALHDEYLRHSLYVDQPLPPAWTRATLRQLLQAEEAVRDAGPRFAELSPYLHWQLQYTRELLADQPQAEAAPPLSAMADFVNEYLGTSYSIDQLGPELNRVFNRFMPMIRLSLLGLIDPAGVCESPQRALIDLPRALLSLAIILMLYREINPKNPFRLTFNSITQLLHGWSGALWVLASAWRRCTVVRAAGHRIEVEDLPRMRSLLEYLDRHAGAPLGDALRACCGGNEPGRRLARLLDVARLRQRLQLQ